MVHGHPPRQNCDAIIGAMGPRRKLFLQALGFPTAELTTNDCVIIPLNPQLYIVCAIFVRRILETTYSYISKMRFADFGFNYPGMIHTNV
jgi:hypothetical protein